MQQQRRFFEPDKPATRQQVQRQHSDTQQILRRRAAETATAQSCLTAAQGRAETQAEKARGATEAKQLRDTIDSMRIEMDSLRVTHQAALTRQESGFSLERIHLMEQVKLLRLELEKRN